MSSLDGAWLREWRADNQYSQSELAVELDVSRQTVVKWEKSDALDRLVVLSLKALASDPSLQKVGARKGARG